MAPARRTRTAGETSGCATGTLGIILPASLTRVGRTPVMTHLVRHHSVRRLERPLLAAAALLLSGLQPISAQQDSTRRAGPRDTTRAVPLSDITVTATRSPKEVFRTASPVIVVDSTRIRRSLANGVAEILRDQPGLDFTGTGANQGRPLIRGQRGQRILLLEDGIRLNNSRRQQDFGELPALVGLDGGGGGGGGRGRGARRPALVPQRPRGVRGCNHPPPPPPGVGGGGPPRPRPRAG